MVDSSLFTTTGLSSDFGFIVTVSVEGSTVGVDLVAGVGVVVRVGAVVDLVVAVEAVLRAGVGVGMNRETGVGVVLTVGTGVSLSGDADLFSETVSDVDRFISVASDRVVAKTGDTATEKIEMKIATMTP